MKMISIFRSLLSGLFALGNIFELQIGRSQPVDTQRRFFQMRWEAKQAGQRRKTRCPITAECLGAMDILDQKAAALFTHISILVATLLFAFSHFAHQQNENWFLNLLGIQSSGWSGQIWVLIAEMLGYVFAALLLLRCYRLMGPPQFDQSETGEEFEALILHEFTLRKNLYAFALWLTVLLTWSLVLFGADSVVPFVYLG